MGAPIISWHSAIEDYFAGIGERANSLSWAHKQAEAKYSALRAWIEVPCICLGVLNGAVSVGSQSLFGNSEFASVGVGAVALITALLGTINSYYAWGKRQEGHRIAAVQYGKLFRDMSVMLSLPRGERPEPTTMLTQVKQQYDQLAETAPIIPAPIIAAYRAKFYKLKDIHHPEDMNGLTAITVFGRDFTNTRTDKETAHGLPALEIELPPPTLSADVSALHSEAVSPRLSAEGHK